MMVTRRVELSASQTGNKADRPWVEAFARAGMAAKGLAYALVGIFALLYVTGANSKPLDFKGAMRQLDENPAGKILLLVLGFGLLAYGLWRGFQTVMDPENEKPEKTRWGKRLGYLVSAGAHLALALFALEKGLGLGDNGEDSDDTAKQVTGEVMALPYGPWLVGVAGAALVVYGVAQAFFGLRDSFKKKLKTEEMSQKEDKWATIAGRLGFFARATVFGTAGVVLIIAATKVDPKEAVGIKGTLEVLATQPIGVSPLVAVAIGLLFYGLFMLIQARRRDLKLSEQ